MDGWIRHCTHSFTLFHVQRCTVFHIRRCAVFHIHRCAVFHIHRCAILHIYLLVGWLTHPQVHCLAHTQAKYFTSTPVSDDTFTPGNNDTFMPGSNCMSTTECVGNCTSTLVYMVALTGVDMSNLEKGIYDTWLLSPLDLVTLVLGTVGIICI